MKLPVKVLSLSAFVAAAAGGVCIHCMPANYLKPSSSSFVASSRIAQYSTREISKTARECRQQPLRVLIFDGQEGTFSTFNLENDKTLPCCRPCNRCLQIIPMLVDALRSGHPERFQRGMPPFQLVFSATDASDTGCMNHPTECDTAHFAPWIQFGSILKDSNVLPTVRAFPSSPYILCMYQWSSTGQTCSWLDNLAVRNNVSWNSLTPQVVWRGSDFHFLGMLDQFQDIQNRATYLNEPFQSVGQEQLSKGEVADIIIKKWDNLLPRWRGVALTIQAEAEFEEKGTEPWINVKFVQKDTQDNAHVYEELTKRGVQVVTDHYMDGDEMSQFKYQVDFGGGGGTSWQGTLSKLAMPGLLFHHETPTKDWFYDELLPWEHYVPIHCNVSDLRAKYEWAEAHPAFAEKIAKAGTQFALRLISGDYMKSLYEQLFIHDIATMVDAYQPAEQETVASILKQYEEDGYIIHRLSTCDDNKCVTNVEDGPHHEVKLPRVSQRTVETL